MQLPADTSTLSNPGKGSWALPPSCCQNRNPDPTQALQSSQCFPFKMLVQQHVKGRHLFRLSCTPPARALSR